MLINALKLNIKTFYYHKVRIIVFAIVLVLLCLAAAATGRYFLYGENFVGPIHIGLVDKDDSFETRLILSNIEDHSEYYELIEFTHFTENEAIIVLENNEIAAIVTLPPNFGAGIISGENIPFAITYATNRPFTSSIVKMVSYSFADMLRSAQTGVYITLNYANAADITPMRFNEIFFGVNVRFLGIVMERTDIFDTQMQYLTGRVNIQTAYLIAAFITAMLCTFFVLTDIIRKNYSEFTIKTLKLRGIKLSNIFFGTVLSYFVVLTLCASVVLFLMENITLALVLSGVVVIFTVATLGAMVTFVFKNHLSSGIFVTLFIVVSLFLSGGVIPVDFFPPGLRITSYFTFNYWAARLLEVGLLGEIGVGYIFMSLLFALVLASFGIYKIGRV